MVDMAKFDKAVQESLDKADVAFDGKYGQQLEKLHGLSIEEIDAIKPGVADVKAYKDLMVLVEEASRHNIATAELRDRIVKLGEVAISLAQKVGLPL